MDELLDGHLIDGQVQILTDVRSPAKVNKGGHREGRLQAGLDGDGQPNAEKRMEGLLIVLTWSDASDPALIPACLFASTQLLFGYDLVEDPSGVFYRRHDRVEATPLSRGLAPREHASGCAHWLPRWGGRQG
ncbi:hypothetical protein MUK42_07377 [Musa troglodytarum]|uniref:Uncharacterized protein n=1 Tax=Musa troglodytarum TaxID=320322 RepID=A0A9E7HVL1_9LILI|nr:hypothetical protein MUK42_07377 [Musa troglodytarum]